MSLSYYVLYSRVLGESQITDPFFKLPLSTSLPYVLCIIFHPLFHTLTFFPLSFPPFPPLIKGLLILCFRSVTALSFPLLWGKRAGWYVQVLGQWWVYSSKFYNQIFIIFYNQVGDLTFNRFAEESWRGCLLKNKNTFFGKQYGASSKKLKTINVWSTNFTSGYFLKRIASWDSNRYLNTSVHSSIMHKSQKVEATHKYIIRWMDEEHVVYLRNRIVLRLKIEEDSDTCYNMDEPRRHYADWNTPDIQGQILCDSSYMR